MQDKKAISTVFATMLLIVLVLVAIVIIWALVRPALLRTSEETELRTLGLQVDTSIQRAWVEGDNLKVTVKRGVDDVTVSDIQLTYLGYEGDSGSTMISEITDATIPKPNEERTYTFEPKLAALSITTVKVAPEVKTSKGTEKLVDVKDEKEVEGTVTGGGSGIEGCTGPSRPNSRIKEMCRNASGIYQDECQDGFVVIQYTCHGSVYNCKRFTVDCKRSSSFCVGGACVTASPSPPIP